MTTFELPKEPSLGSRVKDENDTVWVLYKFRDYNKWSRETDIKLNQNSIHNSYFWNQLLAISSLELLDPVIAEPDTTNWFQVVEHNRGDLFVIALMNSRADAEAFAEAMRNKFAFLDDVCSWEVRDEPQD